MAENLKSKKSSLDDILECPICLFQLKQPYTLQECLHNYCKDCIEAVPKKICDGHSGWFCPKCRNFTREDAIKHNFFISELLDIHNKEETENIKYICRQCPKQKEATWKCVDCKIELCSDCQVSHLMIPILKGHRVMPLNTEIESVVDHLIFCSIHDDEPIKFNCLPCEIPLCIKCKIIQHNTHETETVEMALERLLPKIEEYNAKMEENKESIKKQITAVEAKIGETKENFTACRTQVNEQAEQMNEQIKRIKENHETTLLQQEINAIKGLQETKQQLENKLNEVTNLTSLVAASTAKAKHTSLLNEIQGGLMKKVKKNGQKEQQNVSLEIKKAQFSTNGENIKELEKLFGELNYQSKNAMILKDGKEKLDNKHRYLCDNVVNVIKKVKKKGKQIELPAWCCKINYLDGKLYVCFCDKKQIRVYSTNGELLDITDTDGQMFLVIKKSSNGQFVAGGEDGLYVTKSIESNWSKLTEGRFSDLCVHGDSVSALDIRAMKVITFTNDNSGVSSHKVDEWKQTYSFQLKVAYTYDLMDTIVFLDNHFLICSFEEKTVYKYSTTGQYAHQHITKYDHPLLCCVDKAGNIILVNHHHNTLSVLQNNQLYFTEKDTKVTLDGMHYLRDLAVDEEHNIWVLSGYYSYNLTKYIT